MDVVRLSIPNAFIRNRLHLTWRDVRFGLVHALLDPEAPQEIAIEQLSKLEEAPSQLSDLAGAREQAQVRQLVELLANGEPPELEHAAHDKWLFLTLAWIYEKRNTHADSLQRVEEVYADFGYPEEVAPFVRYMPMDGVDLSDRQANEERLFERWRQYLSRAAVRFSEYK